MDSREPDQPLLHLHSEALIAIVLAMVFQATKTPHFYIFFHQKIKFFRYIIIFFSLAFFTKRMALNYSIYRICVEEGELPTSEDFKLDYKLKFMWLFKIQNLFNFLVKTGSSLKVIFKEFDQPTQKLIKDVALLIMHDLIGKNTKQLITKSYIYILPQHTKVIFIIQSANLFT